MLYAVSTSFTKKVVTHRVKLACVCDFVKYVTIDQIVLDNR